MRFLVVLVAVVASVVALPTKRSVVGFVNEKGAVGVAGITRADGTIELFTPEFSHSIVDITESGIVTDDGNNVQFDQNLHRVKRATIMNDSGMLLPWGQAVVFLKPFTTILLDGPSGMVLSDGQVIQKPAEY